MRRQAYKTVKGVTQYRPVVSLRAMENGSLDGRGFCLACGKDAHGVEPDARRYTCESCKAPKVYGLEELLLMGLLVTR